LKFSVHGATSCSLLAGVALAGLAQAQQPVLPSPTALPSPKPGITSPLQPTLPNRPLDGNPLNPIQPNFGNPTGLKNNCLGGPVRITLEVVPTTVRTGTPVELRVTTQCPPKETQAIEFNANAPGNNPRGAGETMVAFLSQIPRSNLTAGSTATTVRFTPSGLANPVTMVLTATTRKPTTVTSNTVSLRIEGDGIAATTPGNPVTVGPVCQPTLSLNMIPTAVIGGANVPVDLRMSCALTQEAAVQIISSNATLLPGPPANMVRIPAGQTALQFQLNAGRTGSGRVTLRAMLTNHPSAPISPADTLSVDN